MVILLPSDHDVVWSSEVMSEQDGEVQSSVKLRNRPSQQNQEVKLCYLVSYPAPHAASLAIYGSDGGDEHNTAPPALLAGVLYGDGLRLVGRPAACTAHHGPQPGGALARGVHEAEPGTAAGQQDMMGAVLTMTTTHNTRGSSNRPCRLKEHINLVLSIYN